MLKNQRVLLVGCGKMGEALLSGWIGSGCLKPGNIVVVEPNPNELSKYEVRVIPDLGSLEGGFYPEIIFFAIKPQMMPEILPQYREFSGSLFVSIAAGKKISFMEDVLGRDAAIVRAMPNLPAIISRGVSVAVKNDNVSDRHINDCTELLEAVGSVHWVDDEELMDAVTAISGSGPAYVFHFIECLVDAGKELGLPEELATALAYATVNGGAELAYESEYPASVLRQHVTSPGGTTEAAMKVMMSGNALKNIVIKAAEAAFKRSKELS